MSSSHISYVIFPYLPCNIPHCYVIPSYLICLDPISPMSSPPISHVLISSSIISHKIYPPLYKMSYFFIFPLILLYLQYIPSLSFMLSTRIFCIICLSIFMSPTNTLPVILSYMSWHYHLSPIQSSHIFPCHGPTFSMSSSHIIFHYHPYHSLKYCHGIVS